MIRQWLDRMYRTVSDNQLTARIGILSLGFWIAVLLLNPGIKMIGILLGLYLICCLYFTKSLRLTLLLGFITSLPILKGKSYVLEVIPPGTLFSNFYPEGYQDIITVKLSHILAAAMTFFLIKDSVRNGIRDRWPVLTGLLLGSFILMGISAFFYSYNPQLSGIIFVQLMEGLIFFLYGVRCCIADKNFTKLALVTLSALLVMIGTLTFIQYAKGGGSGYTLEVNQTYTTDERNFEESFLRIRPFATFYHANILAAFLVPTLPIFLVLMLLRYPFSKIPFLLASVAILLTMSRSSWISLLIGLMPVFYTMEKIYGMKLVSWPAVKRYSLIICAVFIIAGLFIYPRVISTINTFSESGGAAYVRLEQFKEAAQIINANKLFGIGSGMYVSYLFQYGSESTIFSFPTEVNNAYLMLAAENGLPATIALVFFFLLFIRKMILSASENRKDAPNSILKIAVASGLIAVMINCLFQQLLLIHRDPVFELYILIVLIGLSLEVHKLLPTKSVAH